MCPVATATRHKPLPSNITHQLEKGKEKLLISLMVAPLMIIAQMPTLYFFIS